MGMVIQLIPVNAQELTEVGVYSVKICFGKNNTPNL